jgi:hypothetical protein
MDPKLLGRIAKAITKHPEISTEIAQSFKYNQIVSKEAICSIIEEPSATFLGGWFCTLPPFFYNGKIVSVDIDPTCERLNLHPEVHYITEDASNIITQTEAVVNSSFEHMTNATHDRIFANISQAQRIYISSNNMFHVDEHINCHKDMHEFEQHLSKWMFVDTLFNVELDKGYKRFVAIGYKK